MLSDIMLSAIMLNVVAPTFYIVMTFIYQCGEFYPCDTNRIGSARVHHPPKVAKVQDFCFPMQNRLIQTSQTGGQWYSDTSPFSIPCINHLRPAIVNSHNGLMTN